MFFCFLSLVDLAPAGLKRGRNAERMGFLTQPRIQIFMSAPRVKRPHLLVKHIPWLDGTSEFAGDTPANRVKHVRCLGKNCQPLSELFSNQLKIHRRWTNDLNKDCCIHDLNPTEHAQVTRNFFEKAVIFLFTSLDRPFRIAG